MIDNPEPKSVSNSSSESTNNTGVNTDKSKIPSVPYKGNLVCIGVLPGLASYDDSTSDESGDDSSSDSESQSPVVMRDLCGRRIIEQEEESHSEKKK